MDQRARFIREWECAQRPVSDLCAEYGVSRTIGYKWIRRFEEDGIEGLRDRSRRPRSSPNATSAEMIEHIVAVRLKHPSWGGRKIAATLIRHGRRAVPRPSTIDNVLARIGLTRKRARRHPPGHPGRPMITPRAANDLWTADFKGQFRLRDGSYCYPLTVADQFSRFLFTCRGFSSTAHDGVQREFERLFREYGLPAAIRTDNGSPFASTGLARLSRLSVWWIKLGIHPELTELASPQQNACHERMHRTLKAEATRPPGTNGNIQQRIFNRFLTIYNTERPHEALRLEPPASVYTHAPRPYPVRLAEPQYPAHYEVRYVSENGGMRWNSEWIKVSSVLIGEYVGLEAVADDKWLVYFCGYLIGRLNERRRYIESIFAPRHQERP
jgi:transposase InsO family protein